MWKMFWCWVAHQKYRKHTFEKMMRIHVSYLIICSKCGNETSRMERLRYR